MASGNKQSGVLFPFQIQSGNVLMSGNQAEVIRSRIAFCLGTQVGERVMRPLWGINILNSVYALGGDLDAAVTDAVEEAFRKWFPAHVVRSIKVSRDPDAPTYVTVEVTYSMNDSPSTDTVRVGTQLPDGTEVFDNEGVF